jgi:type VI secretion system secreted protein VgrG
MTQSLQFDVSIGGYALEVRSVSLEEAVSEIGTFTARVVATTDLDLEGLLEEEAIVRVTEAGSLLRTFTLVLRGVSFAGVVDGTFAFDLDLAPKLALLALDRNTRKYRDQTAKDIVSSVLGEGGVAHTFRIGAPPPSRPYCVQYRETNLDFVRRLLEFEGIYFTFDDDGTLLLDDASGSAASVDGAALTRLVDTEMGHGERGILDLLRGARVGSGKATVNDYNWRTPKTSLLQSDAGARDQELEVYDYPVGYREVGAGARLAKLRREALEAEKRYVSARTSLPTMRPGRIFELEHDEAIGFSGGYFVVRVRHTFEHQGPDRPARYENHVFAIPRETPYRPALRTPRPVIIGNHTAMVRGPAGEEIHTDRLGRFKAQFHWDRQAKGTDEDSRWLRMLQEVSSSIALARVGWEVNVGYIDGDPDRPVGLARHINGVMTPTYQQPARKNVMTIKTESYPGKAGFNELRLDDSVGSMRMDFFAQRNLANIVKNDRTEKVAQNETKLVKGSFSHEVERNQTVEIGASDLTTVNADYKLTVDKDRKKTVGGSEKVQAGETITVNVTGSDREKVGGVRNTFTGKFDIQIPKAKDFLKSLVPTPGSVADALVSSVGGPTLGKAAAALAGGKGLAGAAAPVVGALEKGATLAGGTVSLGGVPILGPGVHGGGSSEAGAPAGAPGAGPRGPGGGAPAGGKPGDAAKPDGARAFGGGAIGAGVQDGLSSLLHGGSPSAAGSAALKGAGDALLSGGGLGSVGGALGGLGGLASGGVGDLAKGVGSALKIPTSAPDLAGAVKGLLPSPSGLLSKATGGLSDVRSVDDLLKFLKGTITRTTGERMTKQVGGAYIKLAGKPISFASTKLHAEVVGGMKLTLTGQESISQTVTGQMVSAVGGFVIKKAKGDVAQSAKDSKLRVGASATYHADEKIELRSDDIELQALEKLSLQVGDLVVEMTPSGATVKGPVKLDAPKNIRAIGNPDKLT